MIDKAHIARTLEQLMRLYEKAIREEGQQELLYAKLALLEVCGWIEETMDDMIMRVAQKTLKDRKNRDYVKGMIKKSFGFDYTNNFRRMLISLIGIVGVEKLEGRLRQKIFIKFESTLRILKQQRNTQAHTHIRGTTKRIDAPLQIRQYFHDVYAGFREFENTMKAMGLLGE